MFIIFNSTFIFTVLFSKEINCQSGAYAWRLRNICTLWQRKRKGKEGKGRLQYRVRKVKGLRNGATNQSETWKRYIKWYYKLNLLGRLKPSSSPKMHKHVYNKVKCHVYDCVREYVCGSVPECSVWYRLHLPFSCCSLSSTLSPSPCLSFSLKQAAAQQQFVTWISVCVLLLLYLLLAPIVVVIVVAFSALY